MKHKRLIMITAVVLVVCMASIFMFACADNKEPEPTPTPTPTPDPKPSVPDEPAKPEYDMIKLSNEIKDAITNSFNIDNTLPVGFEYSFLLPLDNKNYRLNLRGYLDTKTATNSKMELSFVDGDNVVFTLSADDEYLYFVTATEKRRITGFNLADAVMGQTLPDMEAVENSFVGSLPILLIDMIFNEEECNQVIDGDKKIDTIHGDLEFIGTLLSGLIYETNEELADKIEDFFDDMHVALTATINNDNKIDSIRLVFENNMGKSDVTYLAKLDNYDPVIVTPSKSDDTFIESKVLNFALEGKVNMTKPNNFRDEVITTYDYEIYVDLDVFAMLRNAISKTKDGLTFDATKLFDLDEGSIYFNLSHKCTLDDGCNKAEQSRGSILTFAYSPRDFGTNEFYLALEPLAILPNGFFDEGLGLGGIGSAIESLLGGYFGTNINPAALFTQVPNGNASTMANEIAGVPTDINLVAVIKKAIDIIGEIRLSEIDGLRIGVDPIVELLYELEPIMDTGNINVPFIVDALFGDATHMYIDVDRAVYGDNTLANYNYYEMFMIIDENVGEYKFDSKRPGPAISIEPTRDINGNIVIFSEDVKNYEITQDSEGNKIYTPFPVSKMEYEYMMNKGMAIEYQYTTVTGSKGTSRVLINDIIGLDLDNIGASQSVKLLTGIADGGTNGSVGGLVNTITGLLKIELNIPGEVYTTNVVVAPNPQVEFGQASDLDGKIDLDRTYNFGDKIVTKQSITLKYGEGENMVIKTVNNIAPIYGNELVSGSKVNALADFELRYNYVGFEDVKTIKVSAPTLAKPIKNETISITAGAEYNKFLSAIKFTVEGKKETSIYPKVNSVTFEVPEGVSMDVVNNKYVATFPNAGTYVVKMTQNGGIEKTFTFNVSDELKSLPTFTATFKKNAKGYDVQVGRVNQLGDMKSIKASLDIEVKLEDSSFSKMTFGVDYKIIQNGVELEANELNLKTFQGVSDTFKIEIINEDYLGHDIRLTYNAIDYDGQAIGGGEYQTK